MARAHKAPYDGYRQKRFVSPHALQRFRERAAAWLKKEGVLEERATINMLDRCVSEAVDAKKVEVVFDTSSGAPIPTQVVDISDPERFPGGAMYALVRRADGKNEEYPEVVITVLTGDMVSANKRDASWRRPDGTEFANALGHRPLAAALASVKPAVKPATVVKPATPVPPSVDVLPPIEALQPAHGRWAPKQEHAAVAAVTAPMNLNDALREAARILKPFAKEYRGSLHFSPDGFTFHFEQVEPTQGEGELKLEDL